MPPEIPPDSVLATGIPTPFTPLQLGPHDWWVVIAVTLGGAIALEWALLRSERRSNHHG
jgi:hypothetical protein